MNVCRRNNAPPFELVYDLIRTDAKQSPVGFHRAQEVGYVHSHAYNQDGQGHEGHSANKFHKSAATWLNGGRCRSRHPVRNRVASTLGTKHANLGVNPCSLGGALEFKQWVKWRLGANIEHCLSRTKFVNWLNGRTVQTEHVTQRFPRACHCPYGASNSQWFGHANGPNLQLAVNCFLAPT